MTWIALLIGIALRLTDVTVPDMATDEAQFALGVTAAHPPLGLWLMQLAQGLVGHTLMGARATSVVAGIATLGLLWLLAKQSLGKRGALLALTIACLFPSAITYSRLAYLSPLLCFFWIAGTLTFVRAQERQSTGRLIALFVCALMATFVKTQGLLLPSLLLVGRFVERKGNILRDPISWVLVLSLLPIFVYLPLHPGIIATLTLNTGSMYGVNSPLFRVEDLLRTIWSIMSITTVLIACAIPFLRRVPWAVGCLCILAIAQQFLLGPGHGYYTAEWIIWSIPIGALLLATPKPVRLGIVGLQVMTTLLLLAPLSFGPHALRNPLFNEIGYWNTHAVAINAKLAGTPSVVVLGTAGHHIRWYLEPQVLVGKDMDLTQWTGPILVLDPALPPVGHQLLLKDERIALFGPSTKPVH